LRERAGDVPRLATQFLNGLLEQYGVGPQRIDPGSLRRLDDYAWPGNVRELANVMQRSFLFAEGDCLTLSAGPLGPLEGTRAGGSGRMAESFQQARAEALADFESRFVRRAIAASAGNVSLAARRAGKERRTFGRLLKKHGIDRAEFASAP
jgi:two-component system response regulator GlrR